MDPVVTQYIGHVISSHWSVNAFTHKRFLMWCCSGLLLYSRNESFPGGLMCGISMIPNLTGWACPMGHLVTKCIGLEQRAGDWSLSALGALACLAFKLCFVSSVMIKQLCIAFKLSFNCYVGTALPWREMKWDWAILQGEVGIYDAKSENRSIISGT